MKFTLVIPYYNRAEFLPRTLLSILKSTVTPTAIFLVDNCSTDSSVEICRNFQRTHRELPIVLLEQNRPGVCYARNLALSKVQTEWVYFFDSDDVLSPHYFEDIRQTIHGHLDLDLVASPTCMTYSDGSSVVRQVQYSASPVDQILTGQLSTQSMFLRTSFLRQIGGWNEKLHKWNDWELGLRVLCNSPKIKWIHKSYHQIFQHEKSLTGVGFSSSFTQIFDALKSALSIIENDKKSRLALAFRSIFISAHLARENNNKQAGCIWNFVRSKCSSSFLHLVLLRCIYIYVYCGGRGAWFISRKIIRFL